ncbi:MAG: RNA-binding protein [Gammaproteobacteria bacterium]|nr:RNA-binding protein [Gammaproteobacteria bacterium]
MWILISKISPDTTHDDIYRFAKRGVKGPWLNISSSLRGKVKRCGILRISDRSNNYLECHGLVSIEPIKFAMQAIERLHGRRIRGASVGVRRYFSRSTERDRRNLFNQSPVPEHKERRRNDRRRAHVTVRKDFRYYEP